MYYLYYRVDIFKYNITGSASIIYIEDATKKFFPTIKKITFNVTL